MLISGFSLTRITESFVTIGLPGKGKPAGAYQRASGPLARMAGVGRGEAQTLPYLPTLREQAAVVKTDVVPNTGCSQVLGTYSCIA